MTEQAVLSAQKVHEYFFLIRPDEWTIRQVKLYREKLNAIIVLSDENLYSAPYLSLFKHHFHQPVDRIITTRSRAGISDITPIKIVIEGCEVFAHGNISRSVVLKIKHPEPLVQLRRSLMSQFSLPPAKVTPHITIAKSIRLDDFNKISDVLPEFNFQNEFVCDKITILKKIVGETKNYQLFQQVGLSGKVRGELNL